MFSPHSPVANAILPHIAEKVKPLLQQRNKTQRGIVQRKMPQAK